MVVLDNCALVEIILGSEQGIALKNLLLEGEECVSVDLLRAELVSVLRKLVAKGCMEKKDALAHLDDALSLVDTFYPVGDLQTEVLSESIRLQHSSYDMFYFVLARRLGATLFTTDRKLVNLCLSHGVDCVAQIEVEA